MIVHQTHTHLIVILIALKRAREISNNSKYKDSLVIDTLSIYTYVTLNLLIVIQFQTLNPIFSRMYSLITNIWTLTIASSFDIHCLTLNENK